MQAASIDCVEGINMMATLNRLHDAATMLTYLETTGLLDAPAWRTLVAEAASMVAASSAAEQGTVPPLDDRQALMYMRDVLDRLVSVAAA